MGSSWSRDRTRVPCISMQMDHQGNPIPIYNEGKISYFGDFPGGSDGKASAYNAGDAREVGYIPRSGQEDLLEEEMTTHSSTLA